MTTTRLYRPDWLLFGLTRKELRRQRLELTGLAVRSFVSINLKLMWRLALIIFAAFTVASIWLRMSVCRLNLRLTDDGAKYDARLIGLRGRFASDRLIISQRSSSCLGAYRQWIHTVTFEWRTRLHFFWSMQLAFRRQLSIGKMSHRGRHFAPTNFQIPVQRYAALGVLVVMFAGLALPRFTTETEPVKPSVINQSKEKDLAVPSWAASVEPWKNLVNEVSHSPNVVVIRDKRQTNILSETIVTVTNTDKKVSQRYTPGQERLLYLMILLGSDGKPSVPSGLCPLDPTVRRKITGQINATASSKLSSNLNGEQGAETSLTLCGYLINSIADNLLNAPNANKRYAGSVPTMFARDLAFNLAQGTIPSRTTYADNFARLYADWNKSESPTYTKLRKE